MEALQGIGVGRSEEWGGEKEHGVGQKPDRQICKCSNPNFNQSTPLFVYLENRVHHLTMIICNRTSLPVLKVPQDQKCVFYTSLCVSFLLVVPRISKGSNPAEMEVLAGVCKDALQRPSRAPLWRSTRTQLRV